MKFFDS